MKRYLCLLLLPLCSCAYLTSTTVTYDPGTGDATERTRVRVYTFFDSKSQLTKFRNTTGQTGNGSNIWSYPSGTSIGALNEESSGSNVVAIAGAVVQGAVQGAVMGAAKSVKP